MARLSWLPIAFFFLLASALAIEASNVEMADNGVASTYHPTGKEGSLQIQDCPKACAFRCSETSHKKPCLFFCNKCCETCLCVPSGTFGRKEECPCYNNWKTKEGKPKCP